MYAFDAALTGQEANTSRRKPAEDEREVVRKKKVTISLSEKSLRALEELRLATDADTDSEVFRNALRLHLALIRAHAAGVDLFMKRNDKEEIVPVTLFADVDGE